MTRRRIIFQDNKGRIYATSEYNGDKSEFESRGMYDYCHKDWNDILKDFEYVGTIEDFVKADLVAQQWYQNPTIIDSIGGVHTFDFEYLPIERISSIEDISADEIYVVEKGNIHKLEVVDD